MNSNGRNRNNTFAGDVLIEGDLVVTGTINGGGGGGGDVTNPMTEDLNANNFAIFNVSEITAGEEGFIKTGPLDLQDNDIINVNEIKGNTGANALYISANLEILENLNMTNKNIGHVNEITGEGGNLKTSNLDLQNNNIQNVNIIYTTDINSQTGATAFNSILNMFNDINMDSNDIFNVDRLTTTHAGVSINLDLVPATEGTAGQVLARDPAFDPLNFNTHKLVWANQSAGGGVTNPMTANLQANEFSIFNAQTLESKSINIMTSGGGLSCANGTFAVPITWGLAQKLSLAPFYQTFNTDYITPATSAGLTLDSKAPDGITDSKITLSAPTININNSTNLAPSNISITGNLQITNSSGYIHGNNLIVRGRNASAVPTPLTIEGTTTSINSSTLNITSSTANNIAGTTNFTGTVRTNTIDANSGGTISVLQNLTLATGRQLRTDLVFADSIRAYTEDLYITGLLPDNKTQTNIVLASPQISLNNQFGPLVPETQVNIAGGIVFNNPVSNPFIHGSNLSIRGRTPAGVATPLTLESTTTTINSSTLTIFSTLANNITGPTYLDGVLTFTGANTIKHVNGLTGYSPSYVNLYLDIIPSTEGTAGQVLTRDPAFNPGNPATHKLVWTTPAIGNVTNPMTAVLDGANYDIENIRKITLQEIDCPNTDLLVFKRLLCYEGLNVDSKSIFNLGSIVNAVPGSTLTVSSPNINLQGNVSTTTNLNVLTARSSTIGVRTTLFKTFGAMPNIDLNTLTPVKINTTIANQRGTNLIPAGGFVNGDKFIIIMYGLLTTVGSGSLNISLNVGATTALNFIVVNVASSNQPCKITIEIDCTVSGNNVSLANNTALLSMERFNTSIRFATANSSNLFDNRLLNNTFDIYMFQSATQTSNFTPLSYTIEQL